MARPAGVVRSSGSVKEMKPTPRCSSSCNVVSRSNHEKRLLQKLYWFLIFLLPYCLYGREGADLAKTGSSIAQAQDASSRRIRRGRLDHSSLNVTAGSTLVARWAGQ